MFFYLSHDTILSFDRQLTTTGYILKSMLKNRLLVFSLVIILGILLFISTIYQVYGRSWKRALFVDPIYKLNTDEKIVALTFDDGPSKNRTPVLLDILDKYQVKATFFMIGQNIEKHPEIARAAVQRGHVVGNHSYSHPRLIFKSPEFVKEEIIKTSKLLQDAGSADYQYFRPPYTNKFVVLPYVVQNLDMKLVTGTYDPKSQYESPFSADKVAQEVITNVQPGSIIYLHDGNEKDADLFVNGVEKIIVELQNQGYRFVTIKEGE